DLAGILRGIVRDLPGLEVSIEVAPDVRPGEEQTAALVRAVQEIVTNTIRHADARELWIDIATEGDVVRLTATDDGRGATAPVLGNGLRGLVERFEALDGEVSIDGRDGFRVTARVPATRPASWSSTTRPSYARASAPCWRSPTSKWSARPTTDAPPSTSSPRPAPTWCCWTCACPATTASGRSSASANSASKSRSSSSRPSTTTPSSWRRCAQAPAATC